MSFEWIRSEQNAVRGIADRSFAGIGRKAHGHLMFVAQYLDDIEGGHTAHALFTPGRPLARFVRDYGDDESLPSTVVRPAHASAQHIQSQASKQPDFASSGAKERVPPMPPVSAPSVAASSLSQLDAVFHDKQSEKYASDNTLRSNVIVPPSPIRDSSTFGTTGARQLRVPKYSIAKVSSSDDEDDSIKAKNERVVAKERMNAPSLAPSALPPVVSNSKHCILTAPLPALKAPTTATAAPPPSNARNPPAPSKYSSTGPIMPAFSFDEIARRSMATAPTTTATLQRPVSDKPSAIKPPTPQKRAASLDPEPLTTSLDLVIDPSPVKRARLAPPVDDATPRSNPLKRSAPAVPEPAPVTKRSADAGLESLKGQLALMKERQLAATAAARLASAAARHPASVPPQADPPAPPAALAAALPRATALLDSSDEDTGSDEEDMDMSLVAPDSMDPQRELTRARVLVGNTQWGIEDAVGPEEADMECDDEEEEEMATTPRPALQPSQPAEGWGSGIKWVGEKIVSVAASFLTSPVKPAPFMSAMPSAIPKPITPARPGLLKRAVGEDAGPVAATATAGSRLVLKKDVAAMARQQRAKQLAERKAAEEERREKESAEKERLELDRMEKERKEKESLELERLEKERLKEEERLAEEKKQEEESRKEQERQKNKRREVEAKRQLEMKELEELRRKEVEDMERKRKKNEEDRRRMEDEDRAKKLKDELELEERQAQERKKDEELKVVLEREKDANETCKRAELDAKRKQEKKATKPVAMTKLAATTLSKNKKKHMVEDPIVADIVEESDMDLCSQQPSSQPTIATTSSMYLKSKIPAASSRHANPSTKNALVPDNPCGWGSIPASVAAVTDFSVPMVIKGSKMKADVSSATPKALPRHHPTKPGVQLQSILKPATPSFDAKLAMKVATGTTVVSLVHQKNGTSTIEDPILEGLYEGTKKAGSGSVLSGVGGNKESNGPATIVDANGELPEIQDSEDDDDDESSDDEREAPVAAKPIEKEAGGAKLPSWVESHNLMKALAEQTAQDPDTIFGSVKPLSLEDVFKGNRVQKRFRDSMAGNWVGNGELTAEEEEEYKRLMGFK